MSDKHVIAALQRAVADLELRLREVVRERDEAYDDRKRARAERDEARAELVGTSQQLGLEREASAQLRAELGERMRETAEAQREACASMVEDADDGVPLQCLADAIREKPLVTDAKADGGTP